ncbi:MAG: sugar phosphate nucleotidyltransferase [Anaerolineae bacterium]|nr:sugar phosphate nucleotidyltransferase [Anaerolineae bacterium]MDW8171212.1 sugar phosphate nucleotidyltransferase [Anaerolineae bacterium]
MSNPHPLLVVLAGGVSSRMWPLREKSLLRFGDEPLLVSQLRASESLGLREVVIVANPENETLIRQQVSLLSDHIAVNVVVQQEARGMGDALLQIAPALGDDPERALMITQVHDVVEESLHAALLAAYHHDPRRAYIVGVEMDTYFPGGYLIVGEDGQITGIVEKPGAGHEPSRYVNIVAHIHPHAGRLLDAIRAEYARDLPSDDHYERAMDALMKYMPFQLVPYRGRWSALKFPWHVLDVMDHFLSRIQGQQIDASAFISTQATISGNVVISAGVRVFPGAAVVGPAYIGRGTIIGNNALVRHSMILDKANVGFTTEVARSYVADGVQMHACRVLDSVFGPNVNFSAGCTTANLRIDKGIVKSTVKGQRLATGRDKLGAIIGEDAFLGVDVMTMPGVKIGAGAQVGPGTHVHQDIPNRARVYVKQTLVIEEGGDS